MANEELPKASKVTVRKVSGGFIVEWDVAGESSPGYGWIAQQQMAMAGRPMVTREHIVPDLPTLEGFLAVLLR